MWVLKEGKKIIGKTELVDEAKLKEWVIGKIFSRYEKACRGTSAEDEHLIMAMLSSSHASYLIKYGTYKCWSLTNVG